jgi:hypothetical protein
MRTDNLRRRLYRVIYIHAQNRFKTVSHDIHCYSMDEAKLYGVKLLKGRNDYFIYQITEIKD